jgi:hypothetical protein
MIGVLVVLVPVASTAAQTSKTERKLNETELVVRKYEKFILNGALLTPNGWKEAGKLFEKSNSYPRHGDIVLETVAVLGETSRTANSAEVETKWTDEMGTVDSRFRYKSAATPGRPEATMTVFLYKLVYTNKHQELGANGEVLRETTGDWEWKIAGPQTDRVTTTQRAMAYLIVLRDKSQDAALTQRLNKTIAKLAQLSRGCAVCAC